VVRLYSRRTVTIKFCCDLSSPINAVVSQVEPRFDAIADLVPSGESRVISPALLISSRISSRTSWTNSSSEGFTGTSLYQAWLAAYCITTDDESTAVGNRPEIFSFVHDVGCNPAQREYAYRSRRGHQHYVSARLSAKPFTL
jgi:hypothetical protein